MTGSVIRNRGGVGREGDRKCGTEQILVMERERSDRKCGTEQGGEVGRNSGTEQGWSRKGEVTGSVVRSRGGVGRER